MPSHKLTLSPFVQIAHLADHPHLIPTLTACLHAEFNHLTPAQLMISRGRRLAESAQRNGVPATFVAMSGKTLLGCASLLPYSVSHRELSPLLADVFVMPDRRGQGIGSALVRHVVEFAAQQGRSKIHLFTTQSEAFYVRLGWHTFDHWVDRGQAYAMMSIDIAVPGTACIDRAGKFMPSR